MKSSTAVFIYSKERGRGKVKRFLRPAAYYPQITPGTKPGAGEPCTQRRAGHMKYVLSFDNPFAHPYNQKGAGKGAFA